MITINRHGLPTNPNIDFDGYSEIVTVSYQIPKRYSFNDVKQALNSIQLTVENDITIDSPHSMYDCTGKAFTGGLDLINKSITDGNVHYTYLHHIRIDC